MCGTLVQSSQLPISNHCVAWRIERLQRSGYGYFFHFTVKHFRAGVDPGIIISFTSMQHISGQGWNIGWLFSSLYCKPCQGRGWICPGYFLYITGKHVRVGVDYRMVISFMLLQNMSGQGWILACLFPSLHCIICQGRGGICPRHFLHFIAKDIRAGVES